MSSTEQLSTLDRYAQVGEFALRVRQLLERVLTPLGALAVGAVSIMFFAGNPGALCFAMIALGSLIIMVVWKPAGIGLPLVPLIAIQNLVVYGLPVITNHDILSAYPEGYITAAGIEVFIFSCSLAAAWRMSMQFFAPYSPASFALPDFQHEGSAKLKNVGFTMILAGIAYQGLDKLGWLWIIFDLLPTGTYSLMMPLVTGTSACGFFLIALFVGVAEIDSNERGLFWAALAVSCGISASGFLLSATVTMIASVAIGLFWSTGRMPWRYLLVVISLLAFLNISKFNMRGRYWQFDEEVRTSPVSIEQMPSIYVEWAKTSFDTIINPDDDNRINLSSKKPQTENKQSLFSRINNLQNLLFVINAIEGQGVTPLEGATYSLIPPLLVPRIMWPDKPRTHEGQILLNVHFGRQDLVSTYKTYVAWGLLPEAYGNFGALWGALLLGAFLGVAFAWIENFTARKLLLSLEGFVSFSILLSLANSTEVVASVLVTMTFQAIVPIVFASMPFLRRMTITRPSG